jgi:hypothetical protein
MSIGGDMLAVYGFLRNEGFLAGVGTVVDIGSIEYEIKAANHDAVFERFFERVHASVPTGRNPETGLYKGGAREFYENLGYEYVALDIDGRFGARVFDLNYHHAPEDLIGWSDLTANLGTIEHVFNQVNCFRVVHDVTKPGGLMLHLSPVHNSIYHGLFQYNPRLFSALAEYNAYEFLGQWASTNDPSFWLPTSAGKKFLKPSRVMVTLMRKQRSSDFVVPLQIDTPMVVHQSALGLYNLGSFVTHDPARPKCDVGFKVDFVSLESRRLSMAEILSVDSLAMLAKGMPDKGKPDVSLRGRLGMLKRDVIYLAKWFFDGLYRGVSWLRTQERGR